MEKTSFDDFLSVVESGQTKTASLTSSTDGNILAKLAEQLSGKESAPTAEGQVTPAASTIEAASPAVVGATQAVETPQVALAGGNLEEAAAGEVPAATKPNQGIVVSANDGKTTTPTDLGKTPAAVAAAASEANGMGKTAEQEQADAIGSMIANSFLDTLVKEAQDGEYQEAFGILKEAGLLDDYAVEGMNKTASQEEVGFYALEKIAASEDLTQDDIIAAAGELMKLAELEDEEELEKEAAYADEFEKIAGEVEADARLEAQQYALELQKEALDEEAAELAEMGDSMEKEAAMGALMNDQEVVSAVAVLKDRGLI